MQTCQCRFGERYTQEIEFQNILIILEKWWIYMQSEEEIHVSRSCLKRIIDLIGSRLCLHGARLTPERASTRNGNHRAQKWAN